jgi:peptidoglycan hydrolase-like protein with peptidoglycan-binding domain
MNPQQSKKKLLFASTLATVMAASAFAGAEGSAKTEKQNERAAAQRGSERASGTVRLDDASDAQVKALQRELSARGLYQDQIDGVVGPKTRSALRNFQTQQGIAASGDLDTRSADALGLTTARVEGIAANRAAPPRKAAEMTGIELTQLSTAQVQKVQNRLSQLGFYQGEIDGVAGGATRTALQRYFQRQTQLAVQGRVSDSAIAALGVQPVRNRAQ